jgi:hypothetical protein
MNYTVDYFIQKFEAIPDAEWNINDFTGGSGRCCALGHCGMREVGGEVKSTDEANALMTCVNHVDLINDGVIPAYHQPTPKARILAALRDVKAKELAK